MPELGPQKQFCDVIKYHVTISYYPETGDFKQKKRNKNLGPLDSRPFHSATSLQDKHKAVFYILSRT